MAEDVITIHINVDIGMNRAFTAKAATLNKKTSALVRELMQHFVDGELRIIPNETQKEIYNIGDPE